jgi:hypothetical protein
LFRPVHARSRSGPVGPKNQKLGTVRPSRVDRDVPRYNRILRPNGNRPVVVAVVAVRMMQVILHHVIDVVSVRNLRMAAVWTVDVFAAVRAALMLWGTSCRVRGTDWDRVLVDVIVVGMVEVSIVQIIDVITVLNRWVTTTRAMLVSVSFMHLAVRLSHRASLTQQAAFFEYTAHRVRRQPHGAPGSVR